MLVIGIVVLLVFLAVEWKVADLPIMPRKSLILMTRHRITYKTADLFPILVHLFRADLSCNILLAQNFLYGFVFWSNVSPKSLK